MNIEFKYIIKIESRISSNIFPHHILSFLKQETRTQDPEDQTLLCICNPATLEAKFRNCVVSVPDGGNSIGG